MRSGTIAIAALAIGAVAVASAWLVGERRSSDPVTRATISLPATQAPPFSMSLYPIVALSPDGQEIVYVASNGSANQLFVRRMNQFEARPISGTTGAHAPFFSPDGRRIAFFSERKLKHVALAGGEPVVVTDANGGLGGTWSGNGTIIFAPDWTGGLLEVDEAGGAPRTLVASPGDGFGYRWPRVLADGDTVIATRWRADEQTATIVAISRSTRHADRARERGVIRHLPRRPPSRIHAQRQSVRRVIHTWQPSWAGAPGAGRRDDRHDRHCAVRRFAVGFPRLRPARRDAPGSPLVRGGPRGEGPRARARAARVPGNLGVRGSSCGFDCGACRLRRVDRTCCRRRVDSAHPHRIGNGSGVETGMRRARVFERQRTLPAPC